MTYKQAVQEFYYGFFCDGTNFHAKLFHLIAKADVGNRILLRIAYPVEVQVYEDWERSADPFVFFERWGFGTKQKNVVVTGWRKAPER